MAFQSLFLKASGRFMHAMHLSGYGFGDDPADTTLTTLAKHPDLAMFYSGTFLSIVQGEAQRGLADVEVREAFVYDEHYRSDVGYLGFHVFIRIREDAHAAIVDYVGPPAADALGVERSRLLLRMPAPSFELPEMMQEAPPGFDRQQFKELQRWSADRLEITKLGEEAAGSDAQRPVSELLNQSLADTLVLDG